MSEVKVKTNIMCSACIEKVTPVLNEELGEGNWKVDTTNPAKILTVSKEGLNTSYVMEAVKKAGYKAEEVPQ